MGSWSLIYRSCPIQSNVLKLRGPLQTKQSNPTYGSYGAMQSNLWKLWSNAWKLWGHSNLNPIDGKCGDHSNPISGSYRDHSNPTSPIYGRNAGPLHSYVSSTNRSYGGSMENMGTIPIQLIQSMKAMGSLLYNVLQSLEAIGATHIQCAQIYGSYGDHANPINGNHGHHSIPILIQYRESMITLTQWSNLCKLWGSL